LFIAFSFSDEALRIDGRRTNLGFLTPYMKKEFLSDISKMAIVWREA
jgi:hypothetical protein